MKVFLDTNVVVSAVATRGLCADLFQLVLAEHDLVVGEAVLRELKRILARKLGLPAQTIADVEAFLRRQATVSHVEHTITVTGIDADDALVVAEAAAAEADVLVTGDHGVLAAIDLPVKTMSPREFWNLLRKSR